MGEKQVLEHWIHLATHIQQLWAEAGNGDDWAKFSRQLAAHYLTAEATASAEAIAYVKLVWTKWLSIDM
jgi:hypothetical protein